MGPFFTKGLQKLASQGPFAGPGSLIQSAAENRDREVPDPDWIGNLVDPSRIFGEKNLSSDWTSWPLKMADHSLESLLQINKDGIKTKYQLEWELKEKLCRK